MTGTIQYIVNNGSILTVVIRDKKGRVHQGHGDPRMTARALEELFPEGIVPGKSRVSFEIAGWGGLTFLGEA